MEGKGSMVKVEETVTIPMEDTEKAPPPQKKESRIKKSSEIWDHYRLMGEAQNVECLYCWKVLKRSDSSTKSMWGHMTAFHQDIMTQRDCKKKRRIQVVVPVNQPGTSQESAGKKEAQKKKEKETPTQPYVKRARAGGQPHTPTLADNVTFALQNALQANFQQQKIEEATEILRARSLSFLDSIPKMNEVINITAGFTQGEEGMEQEHENSLEPASSSGSIGDGEVPRPASGSPPLCQSPPTDSASSPSLSTTNQMSAFMTMATNPLMYMNAVSALAGANQAAQNLQSVGSAFTLNDGQCVSMLMKMALDLDLTMSYHRRRGDIELCFESNRTAEKSGGRGKVLSMSDMGREIRITERVNGNATDSEMWTKTDFNQFHWAMRGKCQKVLLK